ncbi:MULTISPECIES: hypothetical protein [unclassified Roseovarius]|uniref:hypothetical protein n=1 Tax=unclassified Roseovarius TaxID=2614913 RepID=UPI0020C78C7E|nr:MULTISPECIES: hypothetical protein [unclassified Roseovarius]
MFDTAFGEMIPSDLRFYPQDLAAEIDTLNAVIYDKLNNGVYKSGFASSRTTHACRLFCSGCWISQACARP